MQGLGLRVQGSEVSVWSSGFRVWGLVRDQGVGFRDKGEGSRVEG